MALLAGTNYDPSTAASSATTSLLAMTAFDTTNLRLTFTAPASGNVLVRIRVPVRGASTAPNVLLGVLESSTVVGRQAPLGSAGAGATTTRNALEAMFVVTGVSAGSHSWDAAYAVQAVVASTQFNWGGPNNSTGNDAWGGFVFEIWDTPNLLGALLYDPASLATKVLTSGTAMAAFDTTNARLTVTAPASGFIIAKVRVGAISGSSVFGSPLLGVLEGATVRARCSPMGGRTILGANAAGAYHIYEGEMLLTGVSAGSHTYDAAWGNEVVGGSGTQLQYGGPNNASGANAQGGLAFELWGA